jgi:predicted metal-dependent hydrolase
LLAKYQSSQATGVIVRNKLRQLADYIQEGFPEKIVEAFKYDKDQTLENQLAITSEAIAFHQKRSGELWLEAGKRTTLKEKHATAQATLASFLFAYLTGEAKEHSESTIETLRALGRQREVDIVRSLTRR